MNRQATESMNRTATLVLIACAPLLAGCAALSNPGPPETPNDFTFIHEQLTVHSDFYLPTDNRLIRSLANERASLHSWFGIPTTEQPIHVYLFKSGREFRDYAEHHHPDKAIQRAFFVNTGDTLSVYAQWGLHGPEDLRHEVAHGYVHAALSDVPLWLDEGIAEYYELPPQDEGVNRQFVELLRETHRAGRWRPGLARLNRLSSNHAMQQLDYAEAWLWVHFLMETRGEYRQLTRDYLVDLRSNPNARPLPLRLRGISRNPETELLRHLDRLASELDERT